MAVRRNCGLLALIFVCASMFFISTEGYSVESWALCGGSQFCPCGTKNCDGQWPGVDCKQDDACVRQNPTWWRCEPRGSVCWHAIDTWSSCGGSQSCPSGSSTCDAPWRGSCCKHGDVCARQSASWWRCEPAHHYANAQLCFNFAVTWGSCGDKTCCSSPADECVYKSPGWWRCEPGHNRSPVAQTPRGSPPAPLEVRGNKVVTPSGTEVALHGINWFGYNVARQMVDGLGHGGSDAETDFAAVVYQLRLLGYNMVRLPFRYRDLDHPYPKDYTVRCWGMFKEDLRRRLMMPGEWTDKALPYGLPSEGRDRAGYCNSYLPASSTYDRLMYTIQMFVAQGMYVMLDYQPMETEPQPYSVKEFVCKWRTLMSRVAALPNWADIKGRVLVDIMNEPDSMHMRWEASDHYPGVRELYLETMDSLHDLSHDGWLYVVQGTGQNAFGLNWGNGFVSDYNIIRKYGLSDPNYFFQLLLDKPYAHRVIISPHVYPPSITKSVFLGDALWQQCAIAFGYLQTRGYCNSNGRCRQFPVVVGETGSFMKDKTDVQWLSDFADFVAARGGARAYNWAPAAGWLWWAYNENSGDTGGIVWDNWSKLDWTKLRFMINSLGLHPWYKWN